METPYLYKSPESIKSTKAVIILPEIFGLTSFVTGVADRFAQEFGVYGFALDFFYQLTNQPNVFDYATDTDKGVALMDKMTGDDFVQIFSEAVKYIKERYPDINEFIVCGFCFGGRLAYLGGVEKMVTHIISFYGAGAHTVGFVENKTPIEFLSSARSGDDDLQIVSFYGGQDASIPEGDREKTKHQLEAAHIWYKEVVFSAAGHAFFNDARPMYVSDAAEAAWQEVKVFLAG